MSLILSSVTLAWDYSNDGTKAVHSTFDLVAESGAWVPALWRLEVVNILEIAVRHGRNDTAFRDGTLSDLALLPISLDPESERHAWGAILRLAERHRLTVYDATYLELAKRCGLPLASLDAGLRAAAGAENVILLGI